MKNIIKGLIITLGIISLLLSVISLSFYNFNSGIIIIFCCSSVIFLYGLFFEKLVKIKPLTYGIVGLCAVASLFMLFLFLYGKNDNATFDEDAAIVLGAAVRGERVSRVLAHRLDKAVEYHTNNPGAVIVVSGGQGLQEDIPEAVAMERYLTGKGVPKEKIIKEELATSTYENLLFSKEILDETFNTGYRAVVITNDFHIYRASAFAGKLGYNITHLGAKTDWYSIPMNYLRECLAVVKMWALGV